MDTVIIKAGYGGRIRVKEGQYLDIINVEGEQICDFFAFNEHDVKESLSPGHCRSVLRRVYLNVGDRLVTVLRRPMFEIIEDSVGVNDLCMPPCDPERYRQTFGIDEHRSCRMNLFEVMADYNISYEYLPDPVNLFQNTPIQADGTIGSGRSPAKPGDKVVLRALMDVIAVGSACPQDQIDINGDKLTDIKFVVRDA